MRARILSEIASIDHGFSGPGDADPIGLVRCRQVHGSVVLTVGDETAEAIRPREADGLITREPRTVGIQTADCIPALFAALDGSAAAAVHAGWRGVAKGILPEAVSRFAALGASPDKLAVALGPSIGPCCFEVNREVVDTFERDWGKLWAGSQTKPWQSSQPASENKARPQAPVTANNLWVDLRMIARLQLEATGVTLIEYTGHCTYCGPGDLASYRRGTHIKLTAGRQWSWIGRKQSR